MAMKVCPSCGAQADDQAAFCPTCGQPFLGVPRAPEPPTAWEQFKNPLLGQKYQVELEAYRQVTGQVTEQEKVLKHRMMVFISVLFALFAVWVVYDLIRGQMEVREQTQEIFDSIRQSQPSE